MESESELEKERFITLVSPEERLDVNSYNSWFKTEERRIPDLGNINLLGSRENEFTRGETGITIAENSVLLTKADELDGIGLFELWVELHGMPSQDNPLSCKMLLPKHGLILNSQINIDEDEGEEDPKYRYSGSADTWRMEGDDRNLIFFAPADPKFLSQLQFSFSQVHNIPKNPQ